MQVGDNVDLLVTILPPERDPEPALAVTPGAQSPLATPTPAPDLVDHSTQTTMQNLRIVGIGSVAPPTESKVPGQTDKKASSSSGDRGQQPVITFAVGHQDALTLKALKDNERVKMELVLRGAGDDEVAKTDPVTLETIIDRYRFRAGPTPAINPTRLT